MALKQKTLVTNTPQIVKNRAKLCHIKTIQVGKYKKLKNGELVYEIEYSVQCLDGTRHVTLRYLSPSKFGRSFGKGIVLSYPDDNSEVWVSCDCPYHKFHVEFALTKHKSSSIIFSNGKRPKVKNPREIPFTCKHIYLALETAKKDYARLNKTKKVQQKLNVQNLVNTDKNKVFDKNKSLFSKEKPEKKTMFSKKPKQKNTMFGKKPEPKKTLFNK